MDGNTTDLIRKTYHNHSEQNKLDLALHMRKQLSLLPTLNGEEWHYMFLHEDWVPGRTGYVVEANYFKPVKKLPGLKEFKFVERGTLAPSTLIPMNSTKSIIFKVVPVCDTCDYADLFHEVNSNEPN